MAWDFETDPEFQAHLDWMRELIDTEIIPLEPVMNELSTVERNSIRSLLSERVKERGLWGAMGKKVAFAAAGNSIAIGAGGAGAPPPRRVGGG